MATAKKIRGTTSSGYKFSIDADVFKDWRFLKAARKANVANGEDQLEAGLELVALLFNDPVEEEKFYSYLANQHGGRVPTEVVGKEVGEIMKVIQDKSKDAKN